MKKLLLAGALAVSSLAANADLVITAVYDGPLPGGLPKGVELYATADISDLSAYGLGGANNGGGSDGEEFVFPVSALSAGEYLYVSSEAEAFTEFFSFAPDYVAYTAMSINGDDAIELFRDGELWDSFGEINVDGTGTAWDYQDGWAYRMEGTGPASVFSLGDWKFSGSNALDNESSNAAAANPIPVGTYTGDGSGEPTDPTDPPAPPLALISAIQGTPSTQGSNRFGETDVSPLIDQLVTVEAIVVGDFQDGDADEQRNLGGFYLQEETADEDGDPESSEGVFVYNAGADVSLGDKVRLSATVAQYFGETQLRNVTVLEVLAQNQLDQVTPAPLSLIGNTDITRAQNGAWQPDLEAYEGMLVRFVDTLVVTEQFQLDRFNEIKLVSGERPWQFTQQNTPDTSLYPLHLQSLGARTITYDDGLNVQNASVNALDGFAPYSEATAKRMGDTITGLTGVLGYKWAGNGASGATWRVRAHLDGSNSFTSDQAGNSPNPRPESPELPGNLKIASLNVLNYFITLDNGGSTAVGLGPRGADTAEELVRQEAKLVNAILGLDADLLALVEIENEFDPVADGSTAIETLIDAVNAELGSDIYAYVYPGQQFVGTDAIAVAMIYKKATLEPAANSQPALLNDAAAAELPSFASRDFVNDPIFNGPSTNRVSLAASFTHKATGDTFTLVSNHFKSKGSSGLDDSASPNFDQQGGAGFWDQRRLDAATALVEWLATAPTGIEDPDIAIAGDLNAYAQEAPIQHLLANGYYNVEDENSYSYVFDGQIGTLDYVLLSETLHAKMTEAMVWHINADEADALDYNLDFGRSADYFNGESELRSSDHDPLLVAFELEASELSADQLSALYLQLVLQGQLEGVGRFPFLKTLKVWLYYSMLEKASWFEGHDKVRQACHFLEQSLERADGELRPRDWIEGSGLGEWQSALGRTLNNCH